MRSTSGRRRSVVAVTIFFALQQIFLCFPISTWANPQGGQVAAGQAGIQQQGTTLTVTQGTPQAVINWQGFSIGAGEITRFVQPSAASAALNRVLGFGPSRLDGSLTANGQVFLINPNGVVIGPDGRIETGGFVASTLNISDEAFMAGGDLEFTGDSPAGIRNLGIIKATTGDIALIARTIENTGTLQAPTGAVNLAAGNEVLYLTPGTERFFIKSALALPEATDGVTNTGIIEAAQAELRAAGGNVYALAVNNGGAIHATGVSQKNGRVLLTSSGGAVTTTGVITAIQATGNGGDIRLQAEGDGPASVTVAGSLEAIGATPGATGGNITATGKTMTLTKTARVNVSGDAGGGLIRLGGDYQGQNPEVANALETTIAEGAEIRADAITEGDGGRVIVWSDDTTRFLGNIWARGGALSGDGGFAEVSGKQVDIRGLADLRAPQGQWGTFLLDPTTVYIANYTADVTTDPTWYLRPSTISTQLGLGNYQITATDFIHFEEGEILWTEPTKLSLNAGTEIFMYTIVGGGATKINGVNGDLSLTARQITIDSDWDAARLVRINVKNMEVYATVDDPFVIYAQVTLGNSLRIVSRPGMCTSLEDCRFVVNNANNTIPKAIFGDGLGTALNPRVMVGNTTIVNGNGNIAVETDDSAEQASWFKGNLTVRSKGDLTLKNYLRFDPVATGEECILSAEGRFINEGTPLSLFRGAGVPNLVSQLPYVSRMLIFSSDPRNDTGVGSSTWWWNPSHFADPHMEGRIYDKDYADLASVPAGNWFVYLLAPIVTLTPQNASKTYGDDNPVLTWTPTSNPVPTYTPTGLIAGDTLSGTPTLVTTAAQQSGAGDYPITVTGIGSVSGPSGYQFILDPNSATLTVNKANMSITPANFARQYGEANPSFYPATYNGLRDWDKDPLTGAPIPGVIDGVTLYACTYGGGTCVPDVTQQSGAGTYTIHWSGNWGGITSPNYTVGPIWPAAFTINPAPLTATANNLIRRIGDPNPPFSVTYTGLMSWDNPDDANVLVCCGYNTPPDVNAPPGNYEIIPSGGWARNYDLSYVNGIFTIKEPYPLLITADNLSKVYGRNNPVFTTSYIGLQDGDTAAVVSDVQFATTANDRSAVGSYSVTPSGGTFPPYYTAQYAAGLLQITPAPLSVTANNIIRRIGDPNPPFSVTYTGLTAWDDPDDPGVLTCCSFNEPPDVNASPGSYPINPFGGSATNYTITYVPGIFTIKVPYQLIIAADNLSKVYGSSNPPLTVTYTGLQDGDTAAVVSGVQMTTAANDRSPAGRYPITPSGGTFPPYYTAQYAAGLLQVTRAPLTVTANNLIRRIGDPNPPFSVTYTGL
ncbi:MAG: filamentous hemagglutinin N-terminal domain-containing protein, partial [Sedimentisphaerales bacterium]|nr:filamentous hemagglutinin N-terminal domain-containing protein [Sedimentisphaerales bacterium]